MSKITLYYGVRLYSNRIINEDLTKATATYSFSDINFIQGDGINAELTLNNVPTDDSPSYLTVDEKQCWYVISCYKQNAKQVTLQLRRDFLSEKWDLLRNSPFLCEKASTIPDQVSDAKYKKTMNLSQVKRQEVLLSDYDFMRGYVVIYYAKDFITKDRYGTEIYEADDTVSAKWPGSDPGHTVDSAYDIIAIPVGRYSFTDSVTHIEVDCEPEEAFMVAAAISTGLGSACYDVQYIPYITADPVDGDYKETDDNINHIGVATFKTTKKNMAMLYLKHSVGYRQKAIGSIGLTAKDSNLDWRIYNEETYVRLVSPNQSSMFELNPVRNGGIRLFYIYISLKPYQPFFYVQPDFGGLYGADFDDGRGLILAGDFSLTQVSDAWTNYQISNKNYQLSFDRGIQSLDLKNSISMKQADWNIAGTSVNAVAGTAAGALSGFMAGGPAGAVVGGIASAAGGAANIVQSAQQKQWTQQLNDDARSAAIDQFQYQLGNIQALPNTLTKVSAVTQIFKVYPVVEIYRCTEQEEDNLRYAARYNGLDINMICPLKSFESGYVQGSILQFDHALNINQQQALAINEALQNGRYIKEV